ncbi:STAS domain-containing protein [Magnetococcales bacterium HHB-1]
MIISPTQSSVTSRIEQDVLHIAVTGIFDFKLHTHFKKIRSHGLSQFNHIIVNLDQTTAIDSSGIGILLLLREDYMAKDKRFLIVNHSDAIEKAFKEASVQILLQ